jgi:hypothetical protein
MAVVYRTVLWRGCRLDGEAQAPAYASDLETVFAIRSPSVRKRSSTFSPVFAEV